MPSPRTTSITLREKQGGEQKTCSGGPLQKNIPPHTLLSGRMWLLLRFCSLESFQICNPFMHRAQLLFSELMLQIFFFFKALVCVVTQIREAVL